MAARGGCLNRGGGCGSQRSGGSGAAGLENPPSLVGIMEVLGVESEEQLAAEMSQLSTWQEDSEGLLCPHDDPYAESSVFFGTQPALATDQRETRRLVMKRKVLRHRPDGRVEVSNETVNTKSESKADPWSLGLPTTFMDDTISEGEIETSSGSLDKYLHFDDDDWLREDSPCSLLGNLGSESLFQYPTPGRPPTSYIVPPADKLKRTDPVAKFRKYKKEWERFSFPGEDPHESLRLAIRKQMNQPLPIQKPKRLVPNTYVVPTMKSRESLRWGVRRDLARCIMPRRYTSS